MSNEDGEAMVRVKVVALRQPNEEDIEDEGPFTSRKRELQAVLSAQTDDRGQYRIFGLKPANTASAWRIHLSLAGIYL